MGDQDEGPVWVTQLVSGRAGQDPSGLLPASSSGCTFQEIRQDTWGQPESPQRESAGIGMAQQVRGNLAASWDELMEEDNAVLSGEVT